MRTDVYSSPLDSATPRAHKEYFLIHFNAAVTQHVCEQLGCDVTTLPDQMSPVIASYITENGPTIERKHITIVPEEGEDVAQWGIDLRISFHETACCYIDIAATKGFKLTDCLQEMVDSLTEDLPNDDRAYATVEHAW